MGRGHGRTPRRRTSGSGRRAVKGRATLIGRNVLEDVWESGQCGHTEPAMSMYGLCATLACPDCGLRMTFLLRFGRPKAFSVSINDGAERPVGRARVQDAVDFLFDTAVNVYMPEGGADSEGGHVNRDMYRLEILAEVLCHGGGPTVGPAPTVDFERPWRGINCQHEHTLCQAYSDFINLECTEYILNPPGIIDHITYAKLYSYNGRWLVVKQQMVARSVVDNHLRIWNDRIQL